MNANKTHKGNYDKLGVDGAAVMNRKRRTHDGGTSGEQRREGGEAMGGRQEQRVRMGEEVWVI